MRLLALLAAVCACVLLLSGASTPPAHAAALRGLHAPERVSVSRLAGAGLPVTVRVARGTRALRVDVVRARTFRRVGRRTFTLPRRARKATVRFVVRRAAALQGRGPYVLRVRAGRSRKHLGKRILRSKLLIVRRAAAAPGPAPGPAPAPTIPPSPGGGGGGAATTYVAGGDFCGSCRPVADLVRRIAPYRLLALGDFAYDDAGSGGSNFRSSYESIFSGLHAITIPTFGATHDTDDGSGAWEGYPVSFFNASGAPEARGRLSDHQWGFGADLPGGWHLVNVNYKAPDLARTTADLAGRRGQCVIAQLHAPVYGSPSDEHPDNEGDAFASAFEAAGVDVILSAHQHFYERVAYAQGTAFTVGTGGADAYARTKTAAGSRAYSSGRLGVLKLTLASGSWSAQFVDTAGTVVDSASGTCAD